jgi:hypothetical protein
LAGKNTRAGHDSEKSGSKFEAGKFFKQARGASASLPSSRIQNAINNATFSHMRVAACLCMPLRYTAIDTMPVAITVAK